MKSVLKSRKGGVLLYVLGFYIFFLGWFHIQLALLDSLTQSNIYLKSIKRNLNIEYEAIRILKKSFPSIPQPFKHDNSTISYECEKKMCEIFIKGGVNYSFLYVIIEKNEMEWRLVE